MGTLGLSEYEYYTNSPYVNYCKEKGYFSKIETKRDIIRFASYRIYQSLQQKPVSIEKFWQTKEEKPVEKIQYTKEEWAKIKQIHGII
jgi:hypothetical protein